VSDTTHNELRGTWKSIKILSIALAIAASLFVLVALLLNQFWGTMQPEWNAYRTWILAGLALLSFLMLLSGRMAMRKQLQMALEPQRTLAEKLQYYRVGLLMDMANKEFIIILSAIIFLMTGDFAYLAFAAVMLGFMLAARPQKSKLQSILQLSQQEILELE
jgi:hypothetical protein